MDENGLHIEKTSETISWNDISKVEVINLKSGDRIYLTLKDKGATRHQEDEKNDETVISIFPFIYASGYLIFETLRAFCCEYRTNPNEIIFRRQKPETWPSEGS